MTTHQLIQKCLKQDRQAQHLLYTQYAKAMMGICYRYTKSIEDAEDVLQEGFIKVFKNLEKYRGDADLFFWIKRIMINTAITYITKHNRYKNEWLQEEQVLHITSNDDAEINMHAKELIDCIRNLPSGYQTIFNLVAVEGFSHVEVGELMNVNVNTVRSQYKRARTMLIKIIEDKNKSSLVYEQQI